MRRALFAFPIQAVKVLAAASIVLAITAAMLPSTCLAASHVPKKGSKERAAILKAVRPRVQKLLGQRVIFKVRHIEVDSNYAFVNAQPLRPNGRKINYRKTRYRRAVEQGFFDDGTLSLLRKDKGKWKVVEFDLGSTDFPCQDWVRRRGVPESILW
jgi:hypothetical protein